MRKLSRFLSSLFLCLICASAQAKEFQGKISTGGFLGAGAVAANYLPNDSWRFMFGYGATSALGGYVHQLNTSADYYWFNRVPVNRRLTWLPLTTGLGITYSPNKEFFIEAPEEYPEKTYYQQTAVHALLLIGTQLHARFDHFQMYGEYFISITDTYFTGQFNNEEWTSRFCCSAGFSLNFPF